MNFFKKPKKTAICSICRNSSPKKEFWKIEVKAADGVIELDLCKECSDTMNQIKNEAQPR